MYKIFFGFFFGFAKISSTFAPSKGTLSYGVMVTQQILVLLFQVRILVAQQERMVKGHPFFVVGKDCQGLSAKGFARALGDWLLRELWARSVTPFPSARRGGPCKLRQHELQGSFQEHTFLYIGGFSCEPESSYIQQRLQLLLKPCNSCCPFCGEEGIRTPETLLAFTHFPGEPVQPLLHLSVLRDKGSIKIGIFTLSSRLFIATQSPSVAGGSTPRGWPASPSA